MSDLDEAAQAKLREKFPVENIGLKPKITCQACSKAQNRCCGQNGHEKKRCDGLRGDAGCKQWITTAHMHVEFVGHANVTDRLLAVDREWTWEPVAWGQDGLPKLDGNGGLWIKLTVRGVTRYGYGDADGKTGGDAVKEAIGDALKIAAMRFGVGLDLWRKEEPSGKASDDDATIGRGEPPQGDQRNGQHQQRKQDGPTAKELRNTVAGIAKAKSTTYEVLAGLYLNGTQRDLDHETETGRIEGFIKAIHEGRVEIPNREPAGASQ